MTECRDFFLRFDYFIADGAMTSFCFSSFLTGCGHCCIFYFLMAGCFDFFCLGLLTSCTGICLHSCFCTGRCFRDLSRVPVMTECRNFFLRFDYFIADGAMTSFALSGFLTGCCHCCIFYFLMAGCLDLFRLCFLTSCTGICLYSCFCTGRCFRDLSRVPVMTECRNFFLRFDYFIADGAMTSFALSGFLTGCGHCCILHFFVSCCFDLLLIKIST